ncbi:MAG TPA: hypothetical protein VIO33_05515, partial [Burkholderiaceae bacterium]
MRHAVPVLLAVVLGASAARAQVPASELLQPPPDARQFTIVSLAGRHGSAQHWTAGDGTLMGRMSISLRGQVWDEDETVQLGPDGAIAAYRLRGTGPKGDVAETFRVADGMAIWKSQIDAGSAAYASPAFYLPAGWSIRAGNVLAEHLVKTRQDIALLPGGHAHAEELTRASVKAGGEPQTVVAWVVTGVQGTPFVTWTDAQGETFADIGPLSTIRAGFEDAVPALRAAQEAALAQRAAALARSLAAEPRRPVAFTDVRVFVDGNRFEEHRTVVVRGNKIAALGPAAKVAVPSGALVFDGKGKTLLPGLWDCHMHVDDDYTGPSELSLGVTSVRDPGNNDTSTVARRQRRAAGELLFPTVYASSMIDGKHVNAAQVAT